MNTMDGEAGLGSGCSYREKKRSRRYFVMDVEDLEGPESDAEERGTKRPYKEPDSSMSRMRQSAVYSPVLSRASAINNTSPLSSASSPERDETLTGNSGAESELHGAESSGFLPACPVCVPRDRWGERGGQEDIQEHVLRSCCTAEGSIDQASPSSVLEYPVYLGDQHNKADCTVTGPVTSAVTPVTRRPCLFIPVPSPATTVATAVRSVVSPAVSSPVTDTCSPFSSTCSPAGSDQDALGSTSKSLGCSDRDPVSAAAHLHLLGESLSLIGHHLQETDKTVCMSASSSLLLDSLLCALAPLICLTAQIPELRSCTQRTLASTLENIAYMMPGL